MKDAPFDFSDETLFEVQALIDTQGEDGDKKIDPEKFGEIDPLIGILGFMLKDACKFGGLLKESATQYRKDKAALYKSKLLKELTEQVSALLK